MSNFLDERILEVLKIFASTKFIEGIINRVNYSALIVDSAGMYYDKGTELCTILEIVPQEKLWIRTLANEIVYVQPMGTVQDILIYDSKKYITVRSGISEGFNFSTQEYYEEDDLFNLGTQGYAIPVLTGLGYLSFIRSEMKYCGVQFNDELLLSLIEKYPSVLDTWSLTNEIK